jgi:hypothetical protein
MLAPQYCCTMKTNLQAAFIARPLELAEHNVTRYMISNAKQPVEWRFLKLLTYCTTQYNRTAPTLMIDGFGPSSVLSVIFVSENFPITDHRSRKPFLWNPNVHKSTIHFRSVFDSKVAETSTFRVESHGGTLRLTGSSNLRQASLLTMALNLKRLTKTEFRARGYESPRRYRYGTKVRTIGFNRGNLIK